MRVVILGAGGMLGADLVTVFSENHEVFAIGRAECDVTHLSDVTLLAMAVRPEVIINAAAFTRVDACEREAERAYLVNAVGARNAAVAAGAAGAAVVHFSSDYIFDGEKGRPYDEFDRPNPLSVYGRSKLAGEVWVRQVCAAHFIVRTQWLWGKGGPNFVETILRQARKGEELRVVDDQVGSPTFTADVAAAVARLVEEPRFGTYHLTNSGTCTWHGFAQAIVAAAGLDNPVRAITTAEAGRPAPRPRFAALENLCWRLEGLPSLRPYQEALTDYLGEERGCGS